MTFTGGISHSNPGVGPGWTLRHVQTTTSTNADLLAEADAGTAVDRTVLTTDHQTAGRGRLDRRWDAPPGSNLLMSLLFTDPPGDPATLTNMVGLAAIAAIEAEVGCTLDDRLGLKWPNDVLLDDEKLAGVLAQRSTRTRRSPAETVVVGIGLNVGWAPPGASSLWVDLGLDVSPLTLRDRIIEQFDRRLGGGGPVHAEYRDRLLTLGQNVRIELPGDRMLHGRAVDVGADGRLRIETETGVEIIDVGDVIHLRRAPDI